MRQVDVSRRHFLWRPHRMLVHIGYWEPPPGVVAAGEYRPCAWAHTEDDERPLPGLGPYVVP